MDTPTTPSVSEPAQNALTTEQAVFIDKFSIGNLLIPQISLFATNLIKDGFLLLVPFYNIYVWLRAAFHGRRRSWETGEWVSFESFQKRQKLMDKAGLIIATIFIAYFVFIFSLFFVLSLLFSAVSEMEIPEETTGPAMSEQVVPSEFDATTDPTTLEEPVAL